MTEGNGDNMTKDARKEDVSPGICYFNDYSPRYKQPYNIYEKARNHMKQLKNRETMRKLEKI